jgi:uncharacterized protein DUF6455
MYPVPFQIVAAFIMVATSAVLVAFFLRHKRALSTRRTLRMLARAGVEPEVANGAAEQAAMHDARRRCRNCSQEAFCDRWLAGAERGDVSFCPNARVFEALAAPARRPAP